MAARQDGNGSMPYLATSLDFINRPNPVEPHAVPEKHPLNGMSRLEKTTKEEFLRLLNVSANDKRPTKRKMSGEAATASLDLPKLPVGMKRLRIPPTLSGLHQPPPDAGLLPSMSVSQPQNLSEKPPQPESAPVHDPKTVSAAPGTSRDPKDAPANAQNSLPTKPKRNKWSEEETACLLKGVAKFGIGNWTKILKCPNYHFERRTALDLKDRFRVCYPDNYKTETSSKKKSRSPKHVSSQHEQPEADLPNTREKPRSDRKSHLELQKLGIEEPFQRSKRRRRTGYRVDEDEALLKGFERHGNSWAVIREDEELGLGDRTATDLRDRFRTKYPDKYEKAGLAPRPVDYPKRLARGANRNQNRLDPGGEFEEGKTLSTTSWTCAGMLSNMGRPEKENKGSDPPPPAKKQPPTSLLPCDDVFWGAPFDDVDAERITLDRKILDWPSDTARTLMPSESFPKGSIDPLATLNLPRPTAISASYTGSAMLQNLGSLPSLATITAGSASEYLREQLELPSLMGVFGTLEGDGRTGGHFPNLDELLS